jgi:hypothetical protein
LLNIIDWRTECSPVGDSLPDRVVLMVSFQPSVEVFPLVILKLVFIKKEEERTEK